MTIFFNILRRILKNKIQLILILILPSVFMIPISLNMNSDHPLTIGILDNDKTEFSSIFYDNLKNKANVKQIDNENTMNDLMNLQIDYKIIIDKGFTSSLIKGGNVQVRGYYLKESVRSTAIQQYIKSFMDSSKSIAMASKDNETKFYEGMHRYDSGIKTDYKVLRKVDRNRSYQSFGMFLMFMMMTAILYTTLLLRDRENKTFYRTMYAPVSLRGYMFQNILSFIIISFIQVSIMFILLKYLVGIYMGNSAIEMYFLFLFASCVCVSLGVAISSIAKNVVQSGFIGIFLAIPMSFLGGCWWQNANAPDIFRSIGRVTPVYWVMEGVNKLLNDKGLTAITNELVIIMAFAAIFFFFGTWRRDSIKN